MSHPEPESPTDNVVVVDLERPDPAIIAAAANLLVDGRLVAFPTETVYGLGADAANDDAVGAVFATKGRPSTDPLIVHIAEPDHAERVVDGWSEAARRLAAAFWPGPLTLVLPRGHGISDAVTAGGSSVGVRVPAHPVAHALLLAAGTPIAAPSANRFGRISPTTASHVVEELGAAVALILDGGPTQLGVESTVVDLTSARPRVLRPGGIGLEDLVEVLGPVDYHDRWSQSVDERASAPGAFLHHYAPSTPLVLVDGGPDVAEVLVSSLGGRGRACHLVRLPDDVDRAARELYDALRAADTLGADVVVTSMVAGVGVGRAVNDRLFRAAHGRVVIDASPASVDRIDLLTRP